MIKSLKTAASTVVLRDRKRCVGYVKESKVEDKCVWEREVVIRVPYGPRDLGPTSFANLF